MPSNKPQLKTYIDNEIKAKFNYIAKKDNRSDSNLLEHIVLNFVNDYESKHGELIVEADNNITLAKPKAVGKSDKSSASKTG